MSGGWRNRAGRGVGGGGRGTKGQQGSGGRLGGTRLCQGRKGSREAETRRVGSSVLGVMWELAGSLSGMEWGGGET